MPPLFRYSDPRGVDEPATMTAIASNIRWGQVGLAMSAEVGDAATSTIGVDDVNAEWNFVGLRAFEMKETSAPSNNDVIGRFVIWNRDIGRNPDHGIITGTSRFWSIDLVDYNWHLGKRVFTDSDADRPAETAGDRLRWLLKRAAHINLNDYGYVRYPSHQLDATDYRGQRVNNLLADCAVEGGYNFWCDFNEAHGKPELFFLHPSSTAYQASIAISNVPADVNSDTIFYPYRDAVVTRSPSKMAFGVFLAYANGNVYERNDTVGEQYAKLDQTSPMSNVKSEGRAHRVARKFLRDNDTENDIIRVGIKLPLDKVNTIRQGHLVSVKFQHIPGYEDWVSCRVIRRYVLQEEEGGSEYYKVNLELSEPTPVSAEPAEPTPSAAYAVLYQGYNSSGTLEPAIRFSGTGTNPPPGFTGVAKTGLVTYLGSGTAYTGIQIDGTGTVDITFAADMSTVVGAGTTYAAWDIRKNGVSVANWTDSKVAGGFTGWISDLDSGNELRATGVSVAPGDVITATMDVTGASVHANFVPVGTGAVDHRLEVSGTLA